MGRGSGLGDGSRTGQRESLRPGQRKLRVLRIIARLNVGGPAYHVSLLSGRLNPDRFETLLVSGKLGAGEASFEDLPARFGTKSILLSSLGPAPHPRRDVEALLELRRIARRFRPDIVHTHTAKAGLLGRLAARLALGRRVILVHTFHGHVLSGYFGRTQTAIYRTLERAMGRTTDCLIGVSSATTNELVEMGIARPQRFRVLPVGVELDRFLSLGAPDGGAFRGELGLDSGQVVFTTAGRLVAIKRVDLTISAFGAAVAAGMDAALVVVGDGPQRDRLVRAARDAGLGDRVHFLGYRRDLETLLAATDVAVLSSDNEGTPLALIEAAAAGKPAIATDVGGVNEVVLATTGILVPRGDTAAMARAMRELAADPARRTQLGAAAREHVAARYSADRLLGDVEALYEELLADGRGMPPR
jgi:glycosyltransferase involved in cell wall biosynthesis